MGAFLALAGTALAADRAFAPRFSVNDTGNIALAANSLLTCSTPAATCATAQNGPSSNTVSNGNLDNNAYTMAYIDADSRRVDVQQLERRPRTSPPAPRSSSPASTGAATSAVRVAPHR